MSARKYGKLYTSIHRDTDWRTLGVDAQWLYKVLISQPNVDTCGVLPYQIAKWAACSDEMTEQRAQKALNVLAQRWYVVVDYTTHEVLIRTYLQYDVLAAGTSKMLIGALRSMLQVQSDQLRTVLADEVIRHDILKSQSSDVRKLANTLIESLPIAFRKAIEGEPKGYRKAFESLREGLFVFVSSKPKVPNQETTFSKLPKSGTSPDADEPPPFDYDDTYDLATSERGVGPAVSIGASRLIETVVPRNAVPNAHRTILRVMASELINRDGESEDDVAECLRIWLTKPSLGPNALKSCMSEVYKRRSGNGKLSTSEKNFLDLQSRKTGDARVLTPQELFGNQRELTNGS